MPPSKSIGIRLFALILVVAVPLAVFDTYNANEEKRRWVDEASSDLGVSTNAVVNKVTDLIDASHELLLGLAAVEEIRGGDVQACSKLLKDVGARYSKYTNFSTVNADKFIVCSSGKLSKPVNVSKSPNINAAFATRSFAVSPFKFGVLTGKPILVFSEPIVDANGTVTGTINNGLSLTWMEGYLSAIAKVKGERLVVFDGKGTVLASHPSHVYAPGSSIAGTPLSETAFKVRNGQARFVDGEGEEMLVSVATIPHIPGGAYVAACAPLDLVLEDVLTSLYWRLGLLAALVSVSLFIGWTGLRVLVLQPIERLIGFSGRLEEGDFKARTGMGEEGTELCRLGLAYDRMADALETRDTDLKSSEANYRELVESEEQLIHRYLPDTTELFVNGAMAKFFGGTPEEWQGRKWIEHVENEDLAEQLQAKLATRTEQSPSFAYEQAAKNAQGDERWLRWFNRAFFDDAGHITHFQAVAVDLTERREMEQKLQTAMLDANMANRAKSNFLANMSHELRTPLNSIIGFSEMMTSNVMGELPPSYSEYAGFITSSGHHLLNIINDILDLSKIEAGMLRLDEDDVDLAKAVGEVTAMLCEQALKHDNKIRTHVDGDALVVYGDRLRIKQVLLNIMSNAVKFTDNGTVTVDVSNESGSLVVRVTDSGIGMSARDIEKALSPFGQVDGHHLSKRYEGTGLGLPLTDQLMQMHDGRMEIESTPGKGSVITLRFPPHRTRV
ncbi:ATP-binding protein [Pseudomonadota bacterium]